MPIPISPTMFFLPFVHLFHPSASATLPHLVLPPHHPSLTLFHLSPANLVLHPFLFFCFHQSPPKLCLTRSSHFCIPAIFPLHSALMQGLHRKCQPSSRLPRCCLTYRVLSAICFLLQIPASAATCLYKLSTVHSWFIN